MVIGASGFYVWPFNCDAPSSIRGTSRNITIFLESISGIRLISRIMINQVRELSRFPTFLPTAFLTTASPSLALTLTQTLTIIPNPDNSPDHNCSHLLARDAVVRNAVGRKGGRRFHRYHISVHHKTIYKRNVFPIHWCIRLIRVV